MANSQCGPQQRPSVSHCVNLSTELLECPHDMVTGFGQKVGVCKAEATVSYAQAWKSHRRCLDSILLTHRPARVSEEGM